ncbi:hypothetical protein BKI52_17770 [marine bacterium AO1-C]|nr:hypothetical protein BKI52_17770 [marine bacterium AO1-C]
MKISKLRYYIFILSFLWFILDGQVAQAQQPPMWQLTDEDGLPSMEVYDVYQDLDGYIWFATDLGVCRYDGNVFKRYATPTARSKAMSNLTEDEDGRMWFMNFSRQIFYIEKDKDEVKEFVLEGKAKKGRLLAFIVKKSSNELYILNPNGVFSCNLTTRKWKNANPNTSMRGAIWGMVQDDKKNIWYVDADRTLWKHNSQGKAQKQLQLSRKFPMGLDNIFFFRSLWTTGKKGNDLYQLQGDKFVRVFKDQDTVLQDLVLTDFTRDQEGNYWIAGFDGAYCYNTQRKPYKGGLHILPGKAISRIIQDTEGNYWITTLRSGVYFMPSKDVLYYNSRNSPLQDDRINCLTSDEEGNILLGGNNGKVSVFNQSQGLVFQYDVEEKKEVEGLLYDKYRKQVYVSAYGFKIFKKNQRTRWNFYTDRSDLSSSTMPISLDGGIAGSAPKNFTFFGKDHIITSSSNGCHIIRLNPRPNEKPPLTDKFRKKNHFAVSSYVRYRDEKIESKYPIGGLRLRGGRSRTTWGDTVNNRIWTGYFDGLFYYNEDGIARELTDKQNKHGIFALSINQSSDGVVWVGTMEHGLYGIRDTTILYHFNTGNGLVSNFCRVVRPDGKKVWLGTDRGIQLIDPENTTFQLFNRQDGLVTNEIRDLLVQGDQIWVATTKGLLTFNKNELRENEAFPPIYITGLAIWDKPTLLNENKEYALSHDQNNLKISFKGLAYRSRGRFKYKYRMLGLDSSWTYINSVNSFVRYPSLQPGEYEFEVKAVNEDNVESVGFDFIKIKISRHYTQTWWFITLVVLIGVSIISAFFLLRIRHLRRESDIKQDLRSSQLSALKVQMNPHFIFNALNSIQEFILLNEKRLANSFLGKFADLMRLTLDMSNEKQVSLSEELKVLRLYLELEAIRFEDTFHYSLEVARDVDPEEVLIPSMLIQPYVENAVKHGLLHKKQDRRLWIRFFLSPDQEMLCCEVEDNGIGRKKSWELKAQRKTRHKSFAMSATQKRLELLNYGRKNFILISVDDLENTRGEALGTKVHLKIPIESSYN